MFIQTKDFTYKNKKNITQEEVPFLNYSKADFLVTDMMMNTYVATDMTLLQLDILLEKKDIPLIKTEVLEGLVIEEPKKESTETNPTKEEEIKEEEKPIDIIPELNVEATQYYLLHSKNEGVLLKYRGWSPIKKEVTAKKPYLWQYTEIKKEDGSVQKTDPVVIEVYEEKE